MSEYLGTVIVVRTDRMDQNLWDFAHEIHDKIGLRVCIAADEEKLSSCAFGELDHVMISREALKQAGLYCPRDVLWRCGDYFLYPVREKFSSANFFWMLEPDVYINTNDIARFFSGISAIEQLDFTASRYGPTGTDWAWYDSMRPFSASIFQCVFSFAGFSGRAVDHLLLRRRTASEEFVQIPDHGKMIWPNDEVFAATALSNDGFTCKDLNDLGTRVYTRETFKVTPPMSLKRLSSAQEDDLIYHPVLAGIEFEKKLKDRLANEKRKGFGKEKLAQAFGKHVIDDLRLECGVDSVDDFLKSIE